MQQFDIKKPLPHKPLFNPDGDTDVLKRRMIGGNTTNLNDYNNLKYTWASEWYRQAMNNFWIPEEINLSQDIKDYPNLSPAERKAYDKILSFLVFLDSIQTANLPCVGEYITANEVNLCLNIQTFQECVHSQSYSYMLDTICSPDERMDILYQWKTDEHPVLCFSIICPGTEKCRDLLRRSGILTEMRIRIYGFSVILSSNFAKNIRSCLTIIWCQR